MFYIILNLKKTLSSRRLRCQATLNNKNNNSASDFNFHVCFFQDCSEELKSRHDEARSCALEDLSAVAVVVAVVVVAGLRSGTNPVSEQGKVAPKTVTYLT